MRIELDFLSVLTEWPLLVKGVAWTVGLTSVSTVLGLFLGVVLAWSRVHGNLPLRALAGSYVEAIRNTPFIVQLFFIYFGLPVMGLRLAPETASIIAMVVNLSAYATEIIRAGIEATPKGQIEAGSCMDKTIQTRSKALSSFVKASMEGWKSYLSDPAPGNALIKKDNPNMTDDQLAYSVNKLKEMGMVIGGDASKMGIGTMTDARAKASFDPFGLLNPGKLRSWVQR